jgi:hypothetical protein
MMVLAVVAIPRMELVRLIRGMTMSFIAFNLRLILRHVQATELSSSSAQSPAPNILRCVRVKRLFLSLEEK